MIAAKAATLAGKVALIGSDLFGSRKIVNRLNSLERLHFMQKPARELGRNAQVDYYALLDGRASACYVRTINKL